MLLQNRLRVLYKHRGYDADVRPNDQRRTGVSVWKIPEFLLSLSFSRSTVTDTPPVSCSWTNYVLWTLIRPRQTGRRLFPWRRRNFCCLWQSSKWKIRDDAVASDREWNANDTASDSRPFQTGKWPVCCILFWLFVPFFHRAGCLFDFGKEAVKEPFSKKRYCVERIFSIYKKNERFFYAY